MLICEDTFDLSWISPKVLRCSLHSCPLWRRSCLRTVRCWVSGRRCLANEQTTPKEASIFCPKTRVWRGPASQETASSSEVATSSEGEDLPACTHHLSVHFRLRYSTDFWTRKKVLSSGEVSRLFVSGRNRTSEIRRSCFTVEHRSPVVMVEIPATPVCHVSTRSASFSHSLQLKVTESKV